MNEETKTTIVDGVDLKTLTTDQLLAMTEEQWEEFITVVEAAIKAKAAEKNAEIMAKVKAITAKALPVIKYAAGVAVVLRVFGVI